MNASALYDEIRRTAVKAITPAVDWKIVIYYLIPVGVMIAMAVMMIGALKRKSKESKVLFFRADGDVELKSIVIENKLFKMGDKPYYINKLRPLHFRAGIWGTKPFYMFKDDVPLGLQVKDEAVVVSSDTLKEFMEQKVLKVLMTPQGNKSDMIAGIMIGAVIGIVLAIAAFALKVIKV
jgi:hypothetical protein